MKLVLFYKKSHKQLNFICALTQIYHWHVSIQPWQQIPRCWFMIHTYSDMFPLLWHSKSSVKKIGSWHLRHVESHFSSRSQIFKSSENHSMCFDSFFIRIILHYSHTWDILKSCSWWAIRVLFHLNFEKCISCSYYLLSILHYFFSFFRKQ